MHQGAAQQPPCLQTLSGRSLRRVYTHVSGHLEVGSKTQSLMELLYALDSPLRLRAVRPSIMLENIQDRRVRVQTLNFWVAERAVVSLADGSTHSSDVPVKGGGIDRKLVSTGEFGWRFWPWARQLVLGKPLQARPEPLLFQNGLFLLHHGLRNFSLPWSRLVIRLDALRHACPFFLRESLASFLSCSSPLFLFCFLPLLPVLVHA